MTGGDQIPMADGGPNRLGLSRRISFSRIGLNKEQRI